MRCPLHAQRAGHRARIAPTGLAARSWPRARILALWFLVLVAGGAILTLLGQTMIHHASNLAGKTAGLTTTFGFAVGYALHLIK